MQASKPESKTRLYLRAFAYIRPFSRRIIVAVLLSTVVGLVSGVATYSFLPVFSLVFQQTELSGAAATATSAPSTSPVSFLAEMQRGATSWFGKLFIIVSGSGTIFSRLVRLITFIISLTAITALVRFVIDYIFMTVQANGTLQLRQQTFAHLTRLPLRFFNKTKSGTIIARMENDIGGTISMVSKSIADVVINIFMALIFLSLLFLINTRLTLITFPFLLVIGLGTAWVGVWVRKNRQKILALQGDIVAIIHEFLSGIRVVKAFVAEEQEEERWNQSIRYWYKLEVLNSLNKFLPIRAGEIIMAVIAGSLLITGGWFTINKDMEVPELLLFFVLLIRFQQPIMALSRIWIDIQNGLAYAARAFNLLSEPVEVRDGLQAISTLTSKIEFHNVSFDHGEGDVVKNITFTIKRGQVIALVGPSGSGKSTISDLLLRFYEATSGKILIDGIATNLITLGSYRSLFGVVTQDTFLFHDTIRNNIAYALRGGANDIQIKAAAQAAHADEFIKNLPAGYDTMVGERGVRLSGGQRQRIAIARALIRNPSVLILDEATSALDTKAERMVQQAIDHLIVGRTALVVAHRLSTVQKADLILVINKGRLVESGTHQQLLDQGGLYSSLWGMQST